jgi:hypothetical protein
MGFPKVHVFEVRIGTGHICHVEAASGCARKKRGDRVYCKAYPSTDERSPLVLASYQSRRCGVQVWLESSRPSLRVLSYDQASFAFSRFLVNILDDYLSISHYFPLLSLLGFDGNVRCSNFQIAVSELLMRKPLTWGSAKFLPCSRVRHTSLLA